MTKESMINVLQHKAEHIKTRIKPEFFLEVADALEQQPCEDAISRKWLKTAIHNFYHGLKHTPTEEDIQAYIDVAPSEQPKYNTSEWCHDCKEYDQDKHCCPRYNGVIRNAVEEIKQAKMGHWIEIGYHIYECSECGRVESINDFENVYREYPYCHCGSRMVEPQAQESEG
jgi:hypothetical protein